MFFSEYHKDIYGDATRDLKAAPNLASNGHAIETRSVLHLSLCDSLPAYGPINDLSFSLTRNGVCMACEFFSGLP